MSGAASVHHGGDLAAAKRRFHLPDAEWLDLSTGINADAYPIVPPSPEAWSRLPDGAAHACLVEAAAAYYGVQDTRSVVPSPGSQALIQLLPRLRAPAEVAVIGPTYGEHQSRWARCGHKVTMIDTAADVPAGAQVVVLCNPNNPDGRIVTHTQLADLARATAARDGWLVVDEAFADICPSTSAVSLIRQGGVIVLRSFGKFFGLAGLRLGFALASPALASLIADGLGPWAVSGPAVEIGAAALRDTDWIESTRTNLSTRAARLDACLSNAGLKVVGGTPLFRLVETADAPSLYQHLGRHAILVRDFPDRVDRLRFGVPAADAEFARLSQALAEPMAA